MSMFVDQIKIFGVKNMFRMVVRPVATVVTAEVLF